ncbi:MAG: hypothetical protein HC905_01070, partial [Bacteroidales bacterium]|nr:hypothetical protein [Bacteroidales bacterium]
QVFASVISGDFNIAAHPDETYMKKSLFSYTSDSSDLIKNAIQQGKEFVYEAVSKKRRKYPESILSDLCDRQK